MGRTKTLDDKAKADEDFRKFMKKVEDEDKASEDALLGEVQGRAKSHYETNKWDYARLFGDQRSDYQNYDDWGLDRVTNIINSIGNSLRSGNYPSPEVPGSDKASPQTVDNAKSDLGIFDHDYALIIARVQALISGTLSQFSIKSAATQKRELRDVPLSGGLHLFFGSTGSVYEAKNFFTTQMIGSFQIVFEAYMSVGEAKAVALSQILKTTETELAGLNELIVLITQAKDAALAAIVKSGDMSTYISSKAVYQEAVDSTKTDRDKLLEVYNKFDTVTTTIDSYIDRLDLTAFGRPPADDATNTLRLEDLFTPWELNVAERYVQELVAG